MAKQSIWRRLAAAVNREYERRIRAASLVTEYGAGHHGHGANHDHAEDDGEAAVIANVPRGTRVRLQEPPGSQGETAH